MSTPVLMPQMGESIAEGTLVRWIKKVGDTVDRDEPLFEISTDKVDAEIPSPAAGVLTSINVKEGETAAVNSVVATISDASESQADGVSQPEAAAAEPAADANHNQPPRSALRRSAEALAKAEGLRHTETVAPAVDATHRGSRHGEERPATLAEVRRQKSSPLVRRLAAEHGVDISTIPGTGLDGRVTKDDLLRHVARKPAGPSAFALRATADKPALGDRVEPMSVMRKKIAEHMILSRRTSAHVHSVFHVNFSTLEKLREAKKAEYERADAKLTFMALIARATIDAIRQHPVMNASLDGDSIVYKKDINLGVAVALDSGLIVPVIKHADTKSTMDLARAIADVAARARSKKLNPEEVTGGTFTITNPGQFGAQFGFPIINQPQVAILCIGTVEKRPVVIDDAIGIRSMAYLTLGFDHRLIDGAVADAFMAEIKRRLENFESKDL